MADEVTTPERTEAFLSHYPANYGAWAGRPDGVKPVYSRCCESVSTRDRWGIGSQCARKNGHGPEGAYCKQHDPAAVEARERAAAEASKAKYDKWRKEVNGARFYAVLKQIADGHNDARGLAQEVLAKFHEGDRR